MTRRKKSAADKARCEARKFGRKVDQYCRTFNTADAVASAANMPVEELQAIREGKREITEPQKKRILDRFPTIKQL